MEVEVKAVATEEKAWMRRTTVAAGHDTQMGFWEETDCLNLSRKEIGKTLLHSLSRCDVVFKEEE